MLVSFLLFEYCFPNGTNEMHFEPRWISVGSVPPPPPVSIVLTFRLHAVCHAVCSKADACGEGGDTAEGTIKLRDIQCVL